MPLCKHRAQDGHKIWYLCNAWFHHRNHTPPVAEEQKINPGAYRCPGQVQKRRKVLVSMWLPKLQVFGFSYVFFVLQLRFACWVVGTNNKHIIIIIPNGGETWWWIPWYKPYKKLALLKKNKSKSFVLHVNLARKCFWQSTTRPTVNLTLLNNRPFNSIKVLSS